MEKIIYPLWKHSAQSSSDFREQLLGPVSEQLLASGVSKLQICIDDDGVTAAAGLRNANNKPLMDAVVSMWVDSAIYCRQQEVVLESVAARYHGYLVTESEPLVNTAHPAVAGARTEGMCQIVFLQKPPRLCYEEWLKIWQHSHTQIAIDTQSTFGYRQNVIVRALTFGAPQYDAMIEENFPTAAMSSQQAFYAAEGDDAHLKSHVKAMIDSCVRFIDFDKIDVLPSSEYKVQ